MRVQRVIGLAFAASLALPACSFAKGPAPTQGLVKTSAAGEGQRPAYPAALIGQWEPGPHQCKIPLAYDSDGGFKITARMLQGYEHSDTPKKVQLISDTPKAWRIEAIEEHAEDKRPVVDIYVLGGDSLAVTNGKRATTYSRCR